MTTVEEKEGLDRIGGFLLVLIVLVILGSAVALAFNLAPERFGAPPVGGVARLWGIVTAALGLVLAVALATRRPWAPDALMTLMLVQVVVAIVLARTMPTSPLSGLPPAVERALAATQTALWNAVLIAYLLRSRRVALVYRRSERERTVPGWLRVLPDGAASVLERTGAAGFVVLLTLVAGVLAWLVAATA